MPSPCMQCAYLLIALHSKFPVDAPQTFGPISRPTTNSEPHMASSVPISTASQPPTLLNASFGMSASLSCLLVCGLFILGNNTTC